MNNIFFEQTNIKSYYLIVGVFCVSSLTRGNREEVVADQTAGRAVEVEVVGLRNRSKRSLKSSGKVRLIKLEIDRWNNFQMKLI